MARKQFTFYESFAKALRLIRDDTERAKAYDAICDYALYGTSPDMEKLSDAAAIAFELIRPNLDSAAKKAESGRQGGQKQKTSKTKANAKQGKTGREKEKENEIEIENDIENKSSSNKRTKFVPPTLEEVRAYARERKSGVDPEHFFNYFNEGNWKDSKGNAVKNWKQKFMTWEKYNTPTVKDPYAEYDPNDPFAGWDEL